jgi:hypothetical protein
LVQILPIQQTSILGNTPYNPYSLLMEITPVEERLTRIEREFDELKHEVLRLKPRAKGWRQTVGAIPDDGLSRNAEKLGREWREQPNKD